VVITHRYPKSLPNHEVIDGVPVHRVRFRFPEPRPRHLAGFAVGTLATRRDVRRIMEHHISRLVHVQCVSNNGYYALRAARSAQLPLVVSMQGELTMDADQIYQRSATMRRNWRVLLSSADVVTGCSQQVIDEAVATYGDGLTGKARVVRNGVDLASVRAAVPERRDRPYLLGIGRFVPQKGLDLLIDAFAHIADDYPDLDLVLAGDGPMRAELEARAIGSGRADRVFFLGAVPSDRAFSLYAGAAGFVLASRHEPQGIVVLEAMAAGAPVVATRVGESPRRCKTVEMAFWSPETTQRRWLRACSNFWLTPTVLRGERSRRRATSKGMTGLESVISTKNVTAMPRLRC
jgi:glycogen(starch) synthase